MWRREIIRFLNDRMRIVTSLVQPLLFLFVLGSGLQRLSSSGTHGVDLKTFIYPGVLCITVMFTAMFSAASIASLQGLIMICLAGFVGVSYDPLLLIGIFAIQLLLAFSISAFGLMRRLVFSHLDISKGARRVLDPGVTWWGWRVPTLLEVAIVAVLGIGLLTIAIWEFSATE